MRKQIAFVFAHRCPDDLQLTASKSLRQANRNLMSALKQPAEVTANSPDSVIIDCAHPAAQASPLYPRLDRNIPGPRANRTGTAPKPKRAANFTDLRSISPSVVRRKANAALMSAVDQSTPRARRIGFLKPLDVNILDKENSSAPLLLPFTPNANKAASCVEAPRTPNPSPQQTPKQATTPLPTPTPSPNTKGPVKAVDSPALHKLRSLLKDHADSRAKSDAPASGAVGKRVLLDLSKEALSLSKKNMAVTSVKTGEEANKEAAVAKEQAAAQEAMNQQVKALTKVIGKKEEQLQALRCHQTHMTTTIQQLQAEVKKNGAAAAADKAAKTYAADLQTKVSTLEEAIVQVRADLITKDDQLRELTQQAASEDTAAAAEAAAEVKKLKGEKSSLQAQLECKTRQLKDAGKQMQDMQLDAASMKRRLVELHSNETAMVSEAVHLRSELAKTQTELARQVELTREAQASEAAMKARLSAEEKSNAALKAALDLQTQALIEVERDLEEAAAMQSGLSAEEKQQHLAEVSELKAEIASQAAATARLRHSLEQRSDVIEHLTANDVQQQEKINLLKEEVSSASDLVDQLQAALKQAKASNSNSSAELVAGLQSELERQAGMIGELRTQLRTSTEAQEDLRRQTVSLVEAQAHMAQHMDSIVEGPPAAVARMQAHLLEKGELVSQLREVVKAREATIAQLQNEQHQASIMLIAVRAERDRLQHEVNTRPDSDCTASSSSSQVNEPLSRSGSAQSLEYIHRVSPGGSSTELDSPSFRMPATPKPLDRTNSNRSMGSDSNKSVGIAAVYAAPGTSHAGMPAQDTMSAQTSVIIGAGAVPASDKASRGFMNKWMVGLLKGGNANKKKEARISQLLKAAAASGGAVGGGQYCTADAGSHEYCAKAVLRSASLKTGIYQQ
ncbi:hypothetical protein ABBQ38_009553 [Trebouxia sp. C0009 RCD-2024]